MTDISRVLDERRRAIRVDLTHGEISTTASPGDDNDVAILEVSRGGLRIATSLPIPVNAVFQSDLMLADGTRVHPQARVAYCRPQRPDGHDGGYVAKLEFFAIR